MGFCRRGLVKESLVGLAVGFAMLGLSVLLCVLTGSLTVTSAASVSWGMIALFFVGFLIQGSAEEVLIRGYLLPALANGHSLRGAILISSLVFALLHGANAGLSLLALLNLFLFGVFAALYLLRRGSIWGIAGVHAAWNFAQGNLFGVEVSGMRVQESVLVAERAPVGEILNGGVFGLEGGLAVTFVLGLGILLLGMPTKKDLEWIEAQEAEKEGQRE
jgi:membrane protease YdiL (CAAX protease family)